MLIYFAVNFKSFSQIEKKKKKEVRQATKGTCIKLDTRTSQDKLLIDLLKLPLMQKCSNI